MATFTPQASVLKSDLLLGSVFLFFLVCLAVHVHLETSPMSAPSVNWSRARTA